MFIGRPAAVSQRSEVRDRERERERERHVKSMKKSVEKKLIIHTCTRAMILHSHTNVDVCTCTRNNNYRRFKLKSDTVKDVALLLCASMPKMSTNSLIRAVNWNSKYLGLSPSNIDFNFFCL